jgi:hypothetical protein
MAKTPALQLDPNDHAERGAHAAADEATVALKGLDPLLEAGNRLLAGWMAVSAEMLEFGRTRLDRNLEASKAMARSSSFDEAFDLQARYTRSALQDYLSGAGKIADIGTRTLFDSLSAWQTMAERTGRGVADAARHAVTTIEHGAAAE